MSLGYKLLYDEVTIRILKKLDKQISKRITSWLAERLIDCNNPRLWGSALKGDLGEFWRYRVGDYRVLCKIQDNNIIVLVLDIDHRKDVSINNNLFDRDVIPVIRIARATKNLNLITKMYQNGLNFKVIDKFENHNGFDGVMLGNLGWPYHLEFTSYKDDALETIPSLHSEDELVFYFKNEKIWSQFCKNMEQSGFKSVNPVNPYWNIAGKTYLDCDGHRIILAKTDWKL